MTSRVGWPVLASWLLSLAVACGPAPRPAQLPVAAPAQGPEPAERDRAERRATRARAMAAYSQKDWTRCAALFAKARDGYGAASCYALAGQIEPAFAELARAIDDGLRDRDLEHDSDLDPLHADPRWPRELAHFAAAAAQHDKALNPELIQIHHDDQADRVASAYEKIDWAKVAPRDEARRKRVDEILAAGGARAADDYYHAAMVYQHGNSPAEIQRAHDLAVKAVELDPDHDAAKWLAAAAEDRKLMYEHKAQKWGTQYKKVDGSWIVWPVDPAITDEQRAGWNVQPLAAAEAFVAKMNARLHDSTPAK